MSYSGVITIIDDDGEVVFEQQLNTDQIIEALIASHSDEEAVEEEAEAPATPASPQSPKKPRLCSHCKKSGHIARNCPEAEVNPAKAPSAKGTNRAARVENGRTIFSEATYDKVKKSLENKNEWEVVADMGLDSGEVSRIAESKTYEDYANG